MGSLRNYKNHFVLILLLVSLKLISSESNNNQVQKVYVKAIICNVSSTIVHNYSCFAKSYSRTFNTINLIGYSKKPLNRIKVEVKLEYRYGLIFREVMHTPVIDWCKVTDQAKDNLMLKQLVGLIETTVPGVIHECPYDHLIISNRTVNTSSLMSIFPSGEYKMIFFVQEGEKLFFTATFIAAVQTSNRDTFG